MACITCPSTSIPPVHQLNVDSVIISFAKVDHAINNRDYKRVVESTSATIDHIKRSLLFTTLDHRIYGHYKQCQHEEAIRDAKEMITIAPDLPTGYYHLGRLYSMQGKQKAAIKTYETALQNVTFSNNNNSLRQQHYQQEFVKRKDIVMELNDKRIDFVSILPTELSDCIFAELDETSKVFCLTVSKTWRATILACAVTWSNLEMNDNDLNVEEEISKIIPWIAANVHHLTLATVNNSIYTRFIKAINNGYFSNTRSFEMIGGSSSILELNIPLFSNAIQRIGNNLTRLKLEIPWVTITSSNITIKLMSLLDTCPNLIQLTYKLKNLESDDMDGDIQPLTGSQKQYPLMELELYLHRTTRDVMEPLLKCCHRLQRLMLWNCMEDFMDLVDMYCPYLQILSYNTEEYEVMKLDKIKNYNGTVESSGLRALYGLYRFPDANSNPFWRPLSFIERNAATLDEITIWGIPDFREANGFLTNTQLPNLRKLRIPIECEDNNPIVNQLLRYIPTCSALTTLQVGYCETLPKLVDSLIELQRPLQTLELQLLHKRELHNNEDERSLLRLFQYYASTTTVTTSFEKITLFEAGDYYILTDKILDALSDIKTLTEVDVFSLSPKISGQGLQLFFNKLSATKVTHVNLGNLTNCLDEHIITLAKSLQHSLTHIQLDALINITEYSILFLIQKAIHLNQITVNFCIYIDDNEILVQHAKEKNIKYTVT